MKKIAIFFKNRKKNSFRQREKQKSNKEEFLFQTLFNFLH